MLRYFLILNCIKIHKLTVYEIRLHSYMYSQEINAYFYIGIPEARKPLFIIEFIIVIDWSVLFVRKKLFMFIMYVAIHVYFTKNIRKNRLKEKFSRIKGIKVGAYKSYRFFL